jgi:1-acyl-sn-glycerol-3-phosphate acyltransferase
MSGSTEMRDRRWPRRLLTIPTVWAVGILCLVGMPLWLPLLALVDLFRGPPRVAIRCGLFLTWFALCEMFGMLGFVVVAVASVGRDDLATARFHALQKLWSGALFAGSRRIFRFELEVEGQGEVVDTPLLLFMRHASMADTLLPAVLVANVHGTRLRYVMKRELLVDPCLDLVGHRLPNYFVDRFSDTARREVEAIGALGSGLGQGDGVLIYPEGTRFTPERRARIIERLEAAGDAAGAAKARSLRRVLPPREGGAAALLDAAPDADVVIGAHRGFEAAATFPALWRGELVGRRIQVRFWRIPRERIPTDARERSAWLLDQWRRVDAWLGAIGEADTL